MATLAPTHPTISEVRIPSMRCTRQPLPEAQGRKTRPRSFVFDVFGYHATRVGEQREGCARLTGQRRPTDSRPQAASRSPTA